MNIYKNKGEIDECASYRPICLTQIIYKIRSQLLTKRLPKTLRTITSAQQYGYKTSLSTADAIVKLEAHLTNATPETHIVLMGLAKAFGEVNRTLLRTTLYKKGSPIEMITHIRRGHKNTILAPKLRNKYGKRSENKVGGISTISNKCVNIHNPSR